MAPFLMGKSHVMATKFDPSQWRYLGGSSRRYEEIATGKTISRHAYDKLVTGMTHRQKAAHNKLINPELAALRPARGRKGYIKAEDWVKKEIAEQRLEAAKLKKKLEEEAKAAAKIERDTQRLIARKVKLKTIKKRYFPKGRIAWRVAFSTYSDYLTLLKQARETKAIFAYGLGYVGVDNRTATYRPVTVMTMESISKTVSRKDFSAMMAKSLMNYAYIRLAHYFIHLAIEEKDIRK